MNDSDGMKAAAASLRVRTAIGRAAFVDGVEHGVELALRRLRRGDSPDQVEADCKAIAELVREAHTFVGPSGRARA